MRTETIRDDHAFGRNPILSELEAAYRDKKLELDEIERELILRRELVSDMRLQLIANESKDSKFFHVTCTFNSLEVENHLVYHLSLEGRLPMYLGHKDYYGTNTVNRLQQQRKDRAYKKNLHIQYIHSILNQISNEREAGKQIVTIKPAFVYICHLFKDESRRDLDNRNRGIIINGLKLGKITADDNWKNIHLAESGFLSNENKDSVEVFITYYSNGLNLQNLVRKLYGESL